MFEVLPTARLPPESALEILYFIPLVTAMQAFMQGISPAHAGFLELRVRRSNVLEDALNQLVLHSAEFKKPLRVTFISGGVDEEGVDQGGVSKEFFQILVRDIFDEVRGVVLAFCYVGKFWGLIVFGNSWCLCGCALSVEKILLLLLTYGCMANEDEFLNEEIQQIARNH